MLSLPPAAAGGQDLYPLPPPCTPWSRITNIDAAELVTLVHVEDGEDGETKKLQLTEVCNKNWRVHKGKVCTKVKGCSCHVSLTHTLVYI